MYSPYVKQILNSWVTHNRTVPQDWKNLAITILEAGPQLQWRTWWKEESTVIEQLNMTGNINISQDQLLGEGSIY